MPPLHGSRAIKEYSGRGWRKLMELRERHHFPMAKIFGRWESHTRDIDNWVAGRTLRWENHGRVEKNVDR